MLSIAQAVADSGYYRDSKNYYDADALGEPVWFGKGAEALRLSAAVDGSTFDRTAKGELPDGTSLGRGTGSKREHRPGWDLTFSAPKSVSIMALVGGDRRLIEAVNQAARDAVTWMEETAARSRITEGGRTASQRTGNLAVAMFTHDLTRAEEPGLHVHAIAMNATRGPDGKWRSLDSPFLYWLAKEGGLRFQQSLALLTRKLGYEIDVDTTKGIFEIAGIPRALIEAYSTRSKQIAANLAAKGLDRETATTLERKVAAAETRDRKDPEIDRAAKAEAWRRIPVEHGVDLKALAAAANTGPASATMPAGRTDEAADDALKAARDAARALAERQIVFSDIKLLDRAAIYALGHADRSTLRTAIRRLDQDGFLQARDVSHFDRVAGEHVRVQGWTTAEAIATERDILAFESEGRFTQHRIMSFRAANRTADRAAKDSSRWGHDHGMALTGLLTSRDRMVALEGSVESATDRHVILAYLQATIRRGFETHIMTPSAVGASALSSLMRRPVTSIADHLGAQWQSRREKQGRMRPYLGPSFARLPAPPRTPQVWLVAHANSLRPSAARSLLKAAAFNHARVILLDDVRTQRHSNHGPLDQLRQAGMSRFRLPTQPGQDRNELHLAVAALARGEPAAALDHIERAGGRIVAIAASSRSLPDQKAALRQRQDYIADRYAGLAPEQRVRTRVLDLTNRGKDALNTAIRQRLIEQGELGGPTLKTEVLVARSLTPTERKHAISYRPGDVIRFGRAYAATKDRPAIASGEYLAVRDVQANDGKIVLQKEDGMAVTWEPERWGAATASAYRTAERVFAAGDRIVWTRTDAALGIRTGQRDTIVNVHPDAATISIERGDVIRDVDIAAFRHLDHAYAATLRPRERADHVIAHLPADNVELTNLKALTDVALQSRQLTIVTENAARLAQAAEDRAGGRSLALDTPMDVPGAAVDAVRTAADILVERQSVFSERDLMVEATRQGLGHAELHETKAAVGALAATGQLIRREAEVLDPESGTFVPASGWTTLDALNDEKKMLAAEQRGRRAFADRPILSRDDAARLVSHLADRSADGRSWNPEQWTAAIGLLASPHRVTALQGLAGTAKTSTVLAALAHAAQGAGHEVSAMAPTTDAALTLGKAIRIAGGKTVARHLSEVSRVKAPETEKTPVWIVDEASMVSAKTMRDLIRAAAQHEARLFLVFDVLQLGSVGAGRAAGQLIESGMTTYFLDRIVRQAGNPRMRDAIYDMIRQDPARALRNLVGAGGRLLEIDGKDGKHQEGERLRHEAMAQEFVSRPPTYREQTIVIDPTREGVAAVSAAIRETLKEKGELSGEPIDVTILEDASLTRPERATSTSYRAGQIVRFPQPVSLGEAKIERGAYLELVSVTGAEVRLRDESGTIHRWEPRSKSLPVEVYDVRDKELQVGDRIRWTRNDQRIGAVSGRFATVTAIDVNNRRVDVEHQNGNRQSLDLSRREHQHFGDGYAVTAQRAQGATAYPIVNMPSWRLNTINSTVGYVLMSRTPGTAFVVTDSRSKLIEALASRDGRQTAAMDQVRETAGLAEQKVRAMAAERAASREIAKSAEMVVTVQERSRDIGGPGLER
ncbi:MAG: MobF family relaxase [Pseudomonadota bacterium]